MRLTNITEQTLCARILVPAIGYGPTVCFPPDHVVKVSGPKRQVVVLYGDQHIHIEGDFIIDPDYHDPGTGFLQVEAGRQRFHKLTSGAILHVWVHGEIPRDVITS